MNTIGYIIKLDEFILLCSLNGCKNVRGLVNTENRDLVEKALSHCRDSRDSVLAGLINKKYVMQDREGDIFVDSIISHLVKACCEPGIVAEAEIRIGDRPAEYKNLYLSEAATVMLEQDGRNPGSMYLTPYMTPEDALFDLAPDKNYGLRGKRPTDDGTRPADDGILPADDGGIIAGNIIKGRDIRYIYIYAKEREGFSSRGYVITSFSGKPEWHLLYIPGEPDTRNVIFQSGIGPVRDCLKSMIKGEKPKIAVKEEAADG